MFGVLIWEVFADGKLPWSGLPDSHVIHNILQRAKLDQPNGCPNEFYYDIMLSCWRLDPFARITAPSIQSLISIFIQENCMIFNDIVWPRANQKYSDAGNSNSMDLGFDLRSTRVDEKMRQLEVGSDSVKMEALLGQGAFGEVYRGFLSKELNTESISVAVKTIKRGSTSELRAKFSDEARLFAMLNHKNIVSCIGVHLDSDPQFILLEIMKNDLKSYLKSAPNPFFTRQELVNCVSQVANAMDYLSGMRIIHRDLAARNVLGGFERLKVVKLNDFGLSRTLSTSDYYRKVSNDKIPVRWMAPESILERKYSTASDVWSFGVFCWEVFELGSTPYPGVPLENLMNFLLRGNRMTKPQECPEAIFQMMLQCWQVEAEARPRFRSILKVLDGFPDLSVDDENGTRLRK